MRRSTRRVLGALLVAVLAAACGGPGDTTAPPPASVAPVMSPVTGAVIDIDAEGLTQVTAFTLRTVDGRETRLEVGILENGAEFPPGHLAEHMATAAPVKAWFRDEGGGRLVAYRLEDG